MNEGYKEVGKALLALANLIFVIYLLNNQLSSEKSNSFAILAAVYAVLLLYFAGYRLINYKGDEDVNK